MGAGTSLAEIEACVRQPRSVFDGIADFNRYSTPNGALVSAEGILIDLPQAGETCAVSSQSCYIHAEVPTGLAMGKLFPGDSLCFIIVKLRGRNFFARLQLLQRGSSGRILCSRAIEDYAISYKHYIRCCGVAAQREQLANNSLSDSIVFQRFFQGCKVRWIGRIRYVHQAEDGHVEVTLQMQLRGVRGESIRLLVDKVAKDQGPALQPGLWIMFNAALLSQGGRFICWHKLRALEAVQVVQNSPDLHDDSSNELSEESVEVIEDDDLRNEAPATATFGTARKRQLEDVDREAERLCVVCQDTTKTHAFLPCGHFCICEPCAAQINARTPRVCPLCRRSVRGTIRIWE